MRNAIDRWGFPITFTLILLGYFSVWMPGRVVALQLLGFEIGEWIKFLPNAIGDGAPANRLFFYLPPITLAIALIAWTSQWRTTALGTLFLRGFAVLIALLALPPLEVVLNDARQVWQLQIGWIMCVALFAALVPLLRSRQRLVAVVMAMAGILGAALPTLAYVRLIPIVETVLQQPLGWGIGVWLNLLGHLLLIALACARNVVAASNDVPK